jgi:hypothetical protein
LHRNDRDAGIEAISWYTHFETRLPTERLAALFKDLLGPEAAAMSMSTGARIEREAHKKGLDEGRQEGRQQGLAQGRAELLLRQLEARFGAIPAEIDARVRSAAVADLERWAIAVLAAPTLAAVFAG